MSLKPILIVFFLSINLFGFNQSKTISIEGKQIAYGETYLVDFKEKGFLFVAEGEPYQVTYFDNSLNQIWKVNLEKGKFTKDEIRFHITDSGKTIFVLTTGQNNSNFIKSISADGVVSDFVKIKFAVEYSFCMGEDLIVEVFKEVNGASFSGYLVKNEPLNYLKFSPNLDFEKFKLKIPVIKEKGEKKNVRKVVVGGTSSGFYLGQGPEFKSGMEYLKAIKLNYDGTFSALRIPFKISSDYEKALPSKTNTAFGVLKNTSYMLTFRRVFVDNKRKRIYILRGLGEQVSISVHNLNGGLLSTSKLIITGTPTKYKNWNVHFDIIEGETLRADLVFYMKDDSFVLHTYSMNLDESELTEERISFNWREPNRIWNGKDWSLTQLDILTLSEFGGLKYWKETEQIHGNEYGYEFENCDFLKRKGSEILLVYDKKEIKLMRFSEK